MMLVDIITFIHDILDYLFKFLVIGNAGVGKSCLLHQFIEQKCKFFTTLFNAPHLIEVL